MLGSVSNHNIRLSIARIRICLAYEFWKKLDDSIKTRYCQKKNTGVSKDSWCK